MQITIVGGGLFGLATAREAARRGHRVTLHERGTIPSPDAASHDVSKALRHVYGEKSALYAPWVANAITAWRELEHEIGRPIFHETGFLAIGAEYHAGSFEFVSARELTRLGISHEVLRTTELRDRFPMFTVPDGAIGVLDRHAGWLEPDTALEALRDSARGLGVAIHENSPVDDPSALPGDTVVVTAGPWLSKLVPALSPGITPTLQHEWFFAPSRAIEHPVWSFDIATRGFYGFPCAPVSVAPPYRGTHKVATHLHGAIEDPDGPRARNEHDAALTAEFVATHLTFLAPRPVAHRPCFYANSLDGHFIFDRLPSDRRVVIAGGGSGHAFKFGPLLGRFALELVEGRPARSEFAISRTPGRTV